MSLLTVIGVGGGPRSRQAKGLVRYFMSSFGMAITVTPRITFIQVDCMIDINVLIVVRLAVLMATPVESRVHQDRGQPFPL
jgi:preprotein translocase subunit Sec61beta